MRHGGPKLKGTQVYPAKFARHVFKFHLKIKACDLRLVFLTFLGCVRFSCETERAHELRADMACAKIEDGPPEQVRDSALIDLRAGPGPNWAWEILSACCPESDWGIRALSSGGVQVHTSFLISAAQIWHP